MKHSAGPWVVDGSDKDKALYIRPHRTGFLVAYISKGFTPTHENSHEANARLIAAAPDMLRELGNVACFKHAVLAALESRPETAASIQAVFERIDALIAKATGEA